MLVKNVNQPIRIKIGDVEVFLFSIGERKAKVGVDAPDGVAIEITDVPARLPPTPTRD